MTCVCVTASVVVCVCVCVCVCVGSDEKDAECSVVVYLLPTFVDSLVLCFGLTLG